MHSSCPLLKDRRSIILCSEATVVNQGNRKVRAVTLKCRSWGCATCQPDRQAQLIALAKSGTPTTFITLTSNPATGTSPASRARSLAKAWPIIVKRAKKKYGYKTIPYLCVFEATRRGEPHLHILCRVRWIDQPWLSEQMRSLTGAPIVDIREVRNQKQVANYISKYIGKEPHRFATCKRYWTTRDFEVTPFEKREDEPYWSTFWEIRDVSLEWLHQCWESAGYEVVKEGHMIIGRVRDPPKTFREAYDGG